MRKWAWGLLAAFAALIHPARAGATPDVDWPYYNNGADAARFSPLKQIESANLGDLREACEVALGDEGSFQAGPVVVGGTMFVTTPHTTVAIDATDCTVRWRHRYIPEEDEQFPVDRGVAYLDGRVFRGTGDGRLLAIDAATGKELWRVHPADPDKIQYYAAAPIAWEGMVFIGPAASDGGIRGNMAAFDAGTGKEIWRFDTVPMGNEPGAETWRDPDTAKHGGGGTWSSYTLDKATGELFVPVGNPAPDFSPDARLGDNLYTDSLVVLDARTGALKWYYQLDPNDGFDYDLGAAPVLFTDRDGNRRVALGGKDGNVYILDRETHKLLSKTAVTTVSNADKKPTAEGVRVCPGVQGGVEWNGPAYDPQTNALYVGSVDWCAVLKSALSPFQPGTAYLGGTVVPSLTEPKTGWVVALDAANGKPIWRYHAPTPVIAAVTPTAGGLVFTGDAQGNFLAFDAKTGKLLKRRNMDGSLAGGVVTYTVKGQQYLAVTAGNISRTGFYAAKATPRVIIMTTGLPSSYKIVKTDAASPGEESLMRPGPGQGKMLFAQFCSVCHGRQGAGGAGGPSILGEAERKNVKELVVWLKNPLPPMPKLYPEPLSAGDLKALADYVEALPAAAPAK